MKRTIQEIRRGLDGRDGAGVSLIRVLSSATVEKLDPFLMLDVFDSDDYRDYIAGFPMHPHRGIETITFLLAGAIEHQDSLGNKGTILPGGTQWMTAGSGIMHQEMPRKSERMIGFQLWLNLPAKEKMQPPSYREVNQEGLPEIRSQGRRIRLISGELEGVTGGVRPSYVSPQIYFVDLTKDQSFAKTLSRDDTAFLYLFRGSVRVGEDTVPEKHGVLFSSGDELEVSAAEDAKFLYLEGPKLGEPVAWGGPIVMNTKEELSDAFTELHEGTFLKTRDVLGVETLNA